MRAFNRFPLILGIALSVASGVCRAATDPTPTGANSDPKSWREEFAAFLALPEEKRERIRRVDRQLHEDPERQAALFRVLQRYNEWFDRLSPEDQRTINDAPTAQEKIRVIRSIREKQWLATQPKADRERVEQAKTAEERKRLVKELREQERKREAEWQTSAETAELQRWLTPAGDGHEAARQEIARWAREELFPKLTADELQKFKSMGRGPGYLRLLLNTAKEKHVPPPEALTKLLAVLRNTPPVGREELMSFLASLGTSERADFESRFRDPQQQAQARQDLVKLYWQRHPEQLRRARAAIDGKPKKADGTANNP